MPTTKPTIIVPTWAPVCQVDGKRIMAAAEPGGRLYLVNGYPMCSFHRLMRLRVRGKLDYRQVFAMKQEQQKADIDKVVAKEVKTQKENQRVAILAADSQDEAKRLDSRTSLSSVK